VETDQGAEISPLQDGAQDLPRRLDYCQWLMTQTNHQLEGFKWSDESNFHLCDHANGGRPDHFAQDHPVYSLKLMVFAGITGKGKIFGLKIYRNQSMTGHVYHFLLQHKALPDLRANNGGNG
jgi:hypothetical protein